MVVSLAASGPSFLASSCYFGRRLLKESVPRIEAVDSRMRRLLQSSQNLDDSVEVADCEAEGSDSHDAGEHRFAILVGRLGDDEVGDPGADLLGRERSISRHD